MLEQQSRSARISIPAQALCFRSQKRLPYLFGSMVSPHRRRSWQERSMLPAPLASETQAALKADASPISWCFRVAIGVTLSIRWEETQSDKSGLAGRESKDEYALSA